LKHGMGFEVLHWNQEKQVFKKSVCFTSSRQQWTLSSENIFLKSTYKLHNQIQSNADVCHEIQWYWKVEK
jgi:hypothetical protein